MLCFFFFRLSLLFVITFCRNTDDSAQNNDGTENDHSNSNLVATIAATEAAIRIASDIIDSTLAHADDHSEHQNDTTGHHTNSGKALKSFDSKC